MRLINRASRIVIPRQPYVDWANSLDDACTEQRPSDRPRLELEDPRWEYPVYLVDDEGNDADAAKTVRKYYRTVFENELAAWHTDEVAWPRRRGLQTFLKLFDVQVNSIVIDLRGIHIAFEVY